MSLSCTFVPAPIFGVEPNSIRTSPLLTLANNSFFCASVVASWIKRICSAGMPRRDQFLPHIVIDIESAVIFRSGQVAEYKLCRLCIGMFRPDTVHIVHAGIDLTVWVIWQHRVNHPLVECQFPSVIRDFEHIVDVRLHKPCTDFSRLSP